MKTKELMAELLEIIEKYISRDEKIQDSTIAREIVSYLVKLYDL